MGFQSFLNDMAALLRRKKEDVGRRQSLFENVSPGNVGNVFDVSPSNPQFANTFSEDAYGIPVRVLDITGDDALGEIICVSLQQERTIDNAGVNQMDGATADTVAGPLIGIVEFGAGAGIATFEFDIPSPVLTPGFIETFNSGFPGTGQAFDDLLIGRRVNGTLLSLPASSLRVFVRNDANAPYIIQGGQGSNRPAISLNTFKDPGKIRVHATYGRRPFPMKLTRTIPICFSRGFDGGGGPTGPFAVSPGLNFVRITIPPYAASVRFPREPLQSTTLSVHFSQSSLRSVATVYHRGNYIIAPGDEGPIDIDPLDTFIEISNVGTTDIDNLSLVFELRI